MANGPKKGVQSPGGVVGWKQTEGPNPDGRPLEDRMEYGVSRPIGPSRPTMSFRRQRDRHTTLVVPEAELPRSPRQLSGLRRAQLMGLYVRLLERCLERARNGGPASPSFRRADRLVTQVRLRLGLG